MARQSTHLDDQPVLAVQEIPFFAQMAPTVFAKIEAMLYERQFEKRQIIYFPDDACDHVYWLRSGRVRINRISADERELTFRHLFPGDIFGEEAIISEQRRENYAEALTDSLLVMVRNSDLSRLLREEAEVGMALAKTLASRQIQTEHTLAETVFLPVRSRISAALLRLYGGQRSPGETVSVTHQELANLAGTTRETTTAVLHGLKGEGLISLANRRIVILNHDGLEAVVQDPHAR